MSDTTTRRKLTSLDFPCPKCKAAKDEPCVKRSGQVFRNGDRARYHQERSALVPARVEEHGTYGGYQQHRRNGTEPCTDCRRASAAYMARFRRDHPADYATERKASAARTRAMTRLARQYPDEFRKLYDEERTK